MSNIKVVGELVNQFALYEQEVKKPTVGGFVAWMQDRSQQPAMDSYLKMGKADGRASAKVNEIDNAIAILVGMMNKYARIYSKIVMDDLPLNTVEEFGYLAQLSSHKQLTKTALINKSMDGKTTGMDIIRRLVKNGCAKEIENPEDKRSKLLQITEKGSTIIGLSYTRMAEVSKAIVGNLSRGEKQTLFGILTKLAHYHHENESVIGQKLQNI